MFFCRKGRHSQPTHGRLGGSGLDSGVLELLRLASSFLGPPGAHRLESDPWGFLGIPGVDFLMGWMLASRGFLGPPGPDSGSWGLHELFRAAPGCARYVPFLQFCLNTRTSWRNAKKNRLSACPIYAQALRSVPCPPKAFLQAELVRGAHCRSTLSELRKT